MKLFPRDGQWHVEFRTPAGKRKRLSTGVDSTRPESVAEAAAADRIRKFLTANVSSPAEGLKVGAAYNLAEALERTLLTRWKASGDSAASRVRRLEKEVGHWLLKEIDFNRLDNQANAWIEEGLKPATVNRRMSAIRVALRMCVRKKEIPAIPEFPDSLAERNRRERYVTTEEEAAILAFLDRRCTVEELDGPATRSTSEAAWRYVRSLYVVLVETGLRLGEALTLPECDGRVIHLRSGTTKAAKLRKDGDGARVVPLTPRGAEAALALLANPEHRVITPAQIQWCWRRVRANVPGIKDVNLHILRHTCASRLLAAGADLYSVKEWLGHSSIKTTERYAHLAKGRLEQVAVMLARRPVGVVAANDGTLGTQQFHRQK